MEIDLDALNKTRMYTAMGIRLVEANPARAVSTLQPTSEMCWPNRDQPHGGVLFTQMDTTMATAALCTDSGLQECATISLQIQYPAPARGDVFTCIADVEKRGGKVCFVRAETRDAADTLVAVAQGSFRTFAP